MIARTVRSVLFASLAAVVACAAPRKLGTGAQCELNSQCAAPLVCRLAACRTECNTDRDCASGTSCVLDTSHLGACQLEAETHCALDSDCASPLVCRSTRCTNACETDRDCAAGNACTDHACIDTSDGRACVRDSDCDGLVCMSDGRCHVECRTDRDCRFGTVCGGVRCVFPGTDAGTGDGGTGDGGTGDAGCAASSTATSLAVGNDYACAVVGSGAISCWGRNATGTLGVDPLTVASSPTPLGVPGITTARRVVASYDHACAELVGGGVVCWGDDTDGQLGVGTTGGPVPTPVAPAGLPPVVEMEVGPHGTCARTASGFFCWGARSSGALGDGMGGVLPPQTTPLAMTAVMGIGGTPTAGFGLTQLGGCAIEAMGGNTVCWGENATGQAGSAPGVAQLTPLPVPGVALASNLHASDTHACNDAGGGTLVCWGANDSGELGVPAGPPPGPTSVPGVTQAGFALGTSFSCVIDPTTGGVACWGRNTEGQLGDDTTTSRETAAPVHGLPSGRIVAIAAGSDGACAIVSPAGGLSGDVWCWGSNALGLLGTDAPSGLGAHTAHAVRVACVP